MLKELFYSFSFSFVAAFGFGMLLKAPKRALFWGAILGALTYIIFKVLNSVNFLDAYAMFCAALISSILSQIAAKKLRMISTVFSTMAIVPLVPGHALFQSMNYIAQGMGDIGMQVLIKAIIDILAMAIGFGIGAFIFQNLKFTYKKAI